MFSWESCSLNSSQIKRARSCCWSIRILICETVWYSSSPAQSRVIRILITCELITLIEWIELNPLPPRHKLSLKQQNTKAFRLLLFANQGRAFRFWKNILRNKIRLLCFSTQVDLCFYRVFFEMGTFTFILLIQNKVVQATKIPLPDFQVWPLPPKWVRSGDRQPENSVSPQAEDKKKPFWLM